MLLGFPVRQFQLCKGTGESKECLWIDEPAVEEYIKQNYQFTGEKRMVHAEPEWIAGKTEGLCLILDDYSRAQPRFLQAIMELVQNQEYMSWRLPQGSTVVLTSNPDNGQYHVEAQDLAQTSRAISYELKSDIECWAQWAETEGIIGLGINFMLLHPELLTEKCNPRSITNFFNAISSIKDLEAELPLVQLIAEGSVGPEVGTMFTMFVNNKLHLLVSPKQILTHKDWSHIKGLLTECIGIGSKYRADIASVLTTRIINYAVVYSTTNSVTKDITDRIIALITEPELFANDLKYIIVKSIMARAKQKFQSIMLDTKVVAFTLK